MVSSKAAARSALAALAAAAAGLSGCGTDDEALREARGRDPRPNVLWIVWDTVRSDHLSLYGYERPTTPRLEDWARNARVFDDARSAAPYTVPSHASMFTGRVPSEHCTHNANPLLADGYTTVAEGLRDAGFETYAFSANPHIARGSGLAQGFEQVEHPWSERFVDEARRITTQRAREDGSSELDERLSAAERGERPLTPWNLKAAGSLARNGLLGFLDQADAAKPWFAFLNYMEAHRPRLPARRFREPFMTPEQLEASYTIDRSWTALWEYTFGLRELDDAELAVLRATYDASVLELDTLFAELLETLTARGALENTVVVLTSDHGEQLGEHHMLDHQYSVYEPLLRVPLLLYAPGRVAAGRDARPVSTIDLFPTVLALVGVEAPAESGGTRARSLLDARAGADPQERLRLAEEPAVYRVGVDTVRRAHPGFSGRRFLRSLRALAGERYKLIWSSNEDHELYDLRADPGELEDLIRRRAFAASQMHAQLEAIDAMLAPCSSDASGGRQLSEEERRMLEVLGYLEEGGDESGARSGDARGSN